MSSIRVFEGGSDYDSFNEIGVPVSGIFTGDEPAQHPCYHRGCDMTTKINWDALTLNTRAAGFALAKLALSLEGVPPRDRTAKSKAEIRRRELFA